MTRLPVEGALVEEGAVTLVLLPLFAKEVNEGAFLIEGGWVIEDAVVLLCREFHTKHASVLLRLPATCQSLLIKVQDPFLVFP